MPLEKVLELKKEKRLRPKKPSLFFRTLLKIVSMPDLKATKFKAQKIGMEKLKKNEPCLILMNHSSFIDLKIAVSEMYPRPMNIVTTLDGMVGLKWILKRLGCFPTRKFTPDIQLIRDMLYCTSTLKTSVLMYPEAGYSFDGTTTTLPESLGKCVKLLGVPVITIITQGAYARQPLFNNLRKRKINVSAKIEYLLSPKQTQSMSAKEINDTLAKAFGFDAYRWQKEQGVLITEPDRAEGLERLLYKCPNCGAEQTQGLGVNLTCNACGKQYTLKENGEMQAVDGETEYSHIPDWFKWQRKDVREKLENGEYQLEDQVDVLVLRDTRALYDIGQGKLVQNGEGVFLYDLNDKLLHHQAPLYSHSLNADFFWYEIGDVICIGNNEITYCCFPKNLKNVVTKARFATEELYKMKKEQK